MAKSIFHQRMRITPAMDQFLNRVRYALPEGGSLPENAWRQRHRGMLILLWLHAIGLACFGVIVGYGLAHSLLEAGLVAGAAILASLNTRSRRFRAASASAGLLMSSAILVHLSGGYIEMHFHFFVMVAIITLYQDWVPFLVAIAYVVLHHGVVGVLAPAAVYNHPNAWANPWKWAALHGLFVLGSSIAGLVNWRLSEDSHARASLILNSAGEGIYGLDLQGNITFVNPAAARMLGWQDEQLIGRAQHDLLRSSQADDTAVLQVEAWLATVLQDSAVASSREVVFQRKNGTTFPAEYVRTPITSHGRMIGSVVSFTDITRRKQADEALQRAKAELELRVQERTVDLRDANQRLEHELAERKRAEERLFQLAAIVESSDDAILSWTLDGVITSWNAGAERMYGYTAEEVVGRAVSILIPPDRAESARRNLERARRGERLQQYEAVGVRKDGTLIDVSLTLSPIMDSTGTITGASTIVRDITERKKIDRMKNEFISTVSHELRTPLTSIRGSLGLIAGGVAGALPPQAKTMVDIAYKNSERLVRLINDILDIEKIESGKMILNLKPLELMPLVEQALDANRAYAEQLGITLELEQTVQDAMVEVDGDRLMQVLANLLSNAAKFSPSNGTVEVAVSRHEGSLRVAITDHGSGIPDAFRDRIFQKFAQADSSDTRQKGGTGLGLSISKAIVEKLGGQIGFTTEPGVGTTFYFDLPEWHAPEVPVVAAGLHHRERILNL